MMDDEVAFRMEAWGETVAPGGNTVASHWSTEHSPEHEIVEEIVDEQEVQEEVIAMEEMIQSTHPDQQYIVGGEILSHSISQSLDQMAAENLIYMAQDGSIGSMMTGIMDSQQAGGVNNTMTQRHNQTDPQYFECQVTEEVITDDWVDTTGQDRVEIVVDQLGQAEPPDDEVDIALPTDQDEYTASRPHPCDFCSRRFRKKANLMNHMVAHQNDRPHGCNLCGARYANKADLMNHLKIHAYAPAEDEEPPEDEHDLVPNDLHEIDEFLASENASKHPRKRSKGSRGRKKHSMRGVGEASSSQQQQQVFEDMDEDMRILTEAAAQHYAHSLTLEPRFPVTDPRKPCVCQHCGVSFAREKALASHARVHGGDSPFECETCGEMFWDANLLREHTRTKHQIQSSNSEYEPENDESDISDSDSKFGDYYCNTCGMSFHRVDLLRRHARLHIKKELTDPDDGHMCNVCGETFREALDLLAHAEVHARYQPHRCMLCGECFSDETGVSTHVQQAHAATLSANSCLLCGKECRDRRALLKHSWDHSKEREHTCSKCAKTFHNKARLKRHMASHRNKCVSCDICGDQFPDGRTLMNHRHSHSSISGRQFPCRECGKTFGSRSSQQIHIRIHTGERPYGCRFCWKAFADGGTLRKHERIHTGEKPYACAVCPRAFNQRVVLREHIRSHHSGPDSSRGTSLNPFSCAVCSDMFATSQELIQHLIQHSDMNTAMKRQPQVGPRKYKRRRKLKPYEVDRLVRRSEIRKEKRRESEGERESDVWYSDNNSPLFDDEPEQASPIMSQALPQQSLPPAKGTKKSQAKKQKMSKSATDDGYQEVCDSFETVMQSFTSLVKDMKTKPKKKKDFLSMQSARPKMIHTSKTKVEQTGEGKKKTKTLITRTTAAPTVMPQPHMLRGVVPGERNRPRTKNVSYHVLQAEKLPPAVFPDAQMQSDLENILAMATPMQVKSEPKDSESLLNDLSMSSSSGFGSPLKDIKGLEKFNSDLVHDLEQILQSPIRTKLNSESSNGLPFNNEKDVSSHELNNTIQNHSDDVENKLSDNVKMKNQLNKIETRNRGVPKKSFKVQKQAQKQARKINVNHSVLVTSADFKDVIVKEEVIEQDADDTDERVFKCEMCSETFTSRSDLLVHIPIHI